MALESDTGQGMFLNLTLGKLRQRVDESRADDKDVKKRVFTDDNNVTKTFYELVYGSVSGVIKGIELRPPHNPQYPHQYKIKIHDYNADETYFINVSQGRTANVLLSKLASIPNPQEVVKIIPHYFSDTKRTEFTIYQDGNKIEKAYTKDNPNGAPQTSKPYDELTKAQKATFIGALDDFFEKLVNETLNPKFSAVDVRDQVQSEDDLPESDGGIKADEKKPEGPEDDLPF